MKIPLRNPPAGARTVAIEDGRHVGVIVQVANVGLQPAFEKGDPPAPSVAIAVEFPQGTIARTIRISQHPSSHFYSLQLACGFGDAEELELGDFLGKPVACEIENRGTWSNIRSYGPIESFENAPAPRSPLVQFDVEVLEKGEGRAEFLKLHPDIRQAISRRIRVRS